MNHLLYIPPGKTLRIRPDFSDNPVVIRLPRDRRLAMVLLVLVCLWGAIGTVGTFGIFAALTREAGGFARLWPPALALVVTGCILLIGWKALRLYVSENIIVINDGRVCLKRRSLWSTQDWCEPLSGYKGLAGRTLKTKKNARGLPYQIVELVHRQKEKTLPVFVDQGSSIPSYLMDDIANGLGIQVLRDNRKPHKH